MGAVDFHMLGPLDAVAADESVPLGGPKQRALLALLLIRANEVVSVDTLIEELWGESPPRTAPAYVQNCVSRLRKALGTELLETRPPGYVLRVDPQTIDARRFERLVREARDQPARERAAGLRRALDLWRGPPLADLAFESFAQTEARRLEELRLAALEDRIEAELELGMHAELVGELEALARENAARERLRRLQMLALYRAGRQVDALASYQEARLALDELGLEPGEELRALERMILVHDPSLGAAAPERPQAPTEEAPVREARRPVCVLLAELVLDPELDPEAARREASRCLAEAEAIVERHGGAVEQLLGEEIVAIFGVPAAHEDDALRALRAAVELREAVAPVDVRAAAVTGELVVGGKSLSGGVITVARRVKESSAAGEILLGPRLRQVAGAAVETDAARLVGLVEGAKPLPLRLDTPFVGRQAELEQLQLSAREAFSARSCRNLVVVGEPGVGKSRLATELAATLAAEARVLTGRCVPYGEGATYLPLRDVLGDAFGGKDLRASIRRALKGDENASRIAEFLVSAIAGTAPATAGDTQWAARRLLEVLARKRPLLVVLEDVHWAEPTFLDLVEYVAGWSEDAPIVLLSLARPELLDARPAWAAGAVALRPLSREEAEALVHELPEAKLVGEDALAGVLDAAEGNPLFLEQLAAAAAEERIEAGRVPPSLDALLASRLDRLPPDQRAVLERAAVAGREFTRAAVEALWESDETGSVARSLMDFARRRLVQPDRAAPGEDAFRFDHVLIRDAAYAAITKGERARLHERLARWLDERGELDEIVGYHFEQAASYSRETGVANAELSAEACARLRSAATGALRRGENRAAAGLFARASAQATDEGARLELDLLHGTSVKFYGDWPSAERLLDDVVRRAEGQGDRRVAFRARIEQAWPLFSSGRASADGILALVRKSLPVLRKMGDEYGLARAWHIEIAIRGAVSTGLAAEAAAAEQAREHYLRAGFGAGHVAPILANIAYHGELGVPAAEERCRVLLAEAASPYWSCYIIPWLARLEAMGGQFEAARNDLETARELQLPFDGPAAVAMSWAPAAAFVELMAGDAIRAEQILASACDELRDSPHLMSYAANTAQRAEAIYREQRFQEALEASLESRAAAPRGDRWTMLLARRVEAKARAQVGDLRRAVSLARDLPAMCSPELPNERALTLLDVAEVYRIKGNVEAAREALEEAHALFRAKQNVVAADVTSAQLLALSA